ncbi:hypothetical protein DMUE_5803 [Dictyocoela muelleri]|nr:hypothetical protein DMUE_5803 [Dictyocoela muelleri]
MKFYDRKREYFYCRTACKMIILIRNHSILQKLRIQYRKFIFFVIFFNRESMTKNLLRNLKISRTTIIELKNCIESKIFILNKTESKLGGNNVIYEADESLIASSKCGFGYFPEQT